MGLPADEQIVIDLVKVLDAGHLVGVRFVGWKFKEAAVERLGPMPFLHEGAATEPISLQLLAAKAVIQITVREDHVVVADLGLQGQAAEVALLPLRLAGLQECLLFSSVLKFHEVERKDALSELPVVLIIDVVDLSDEAAQVTLVLGKPLLLGTTDFFQPGPRFFVVR